MSELKELPEGWKWVRFEDVCDIISGKNQSKVINPNGKYPIYGSSGIFGFADEYLCEGGTTIIGRKGTINKPLFVNTKFWNVDTAFGLSTNENYDSKLLYYFCLSFNFQKLDKSTTIPSLAKRDLLVIDIPLPPLPTQQSIVSKIEELFSELDKGVENLKAAQQQLKVYRQSVLKWAFEGKLTSLNHDPLYLPDAHDLAMVAEPQEVYQSKKNQGNQENPKNHGADKEGLPMGWKWVRLGDVTEKVEKVKRKEKLLGEKLIYLDIGGVNNQINKIVTYKEFAWEDAPSRAQQIVNYNDVLFSTVRTYMKNIAIIDNIKFDKQIASSGFCVIRYKTNISSAKYLFYLSISDLFVNPLNEMQTGSSYPAVRDKDIFSQKVALPPLDEQTQIVQEIESRLSVADKMEETIQQSLLQAESLRQSILKKAFEGKLIV